MKIVVSYPFFALGFQNGTGFVTGCDQFLCTAHHAHARLVGPISPGTLLDILPRLARNDGREPASLLTLDVLAHFLRLRELVGIVGMSVNDALAAGFELGIEEVEALLQARDGLGFLAHAI